MDAATCLAEQFLFHAVVLGWELGITAADVRCLWSSPGSICVGTERSGGVRGSSRGHPSGCLQLSIRVTAGRYEHYQQ